MKYIPPSADGNDGLLFPQPVQESTKSLFGCLLGMLIVIFPQLGLMDKPGTRKGVSNFIIGILLFVLYHIAFSGLVVVDSHFMVFSDDLRNQ